MLLTQQEAEYNELKKEILSAARHGEALLDSLRQLIGKSTADHLGNIAAVERHVLYFYYCLKYLEHLYISLIILIHVNYLVIITRFIL
jgi:hypothetical protein